MLASGSAVPTKSGVAGSISPGVADCPCRFVAILSFAGGGESEAIGDLAGSCALPGSNSAVGGATPTFVSVASTAGDAGAFSGGVAGCVVTIFWFVGGEASGAIGGSAGSCMLPGSRSPVGKPTLTFGAGASMADAVDAFPPGIAVVGAGAADAEAGGVGVLASSTASASGKSPVRGSSNAAAGGRGPAGELGAVASGPMESEVFTPCKNAIRGPVRARGERRGPGKICRVVHAGPL